MCLDPRGMGRALRLIRLPGVLLHNGSGVDLSTRRVVPIRSQFANDNLARSLSSHGFSWSWAFSGAAFHGVPQGAPQGWATIGDCLFLPDGRILQEGQSRTECPMTQASDAQFSRSRSSIENP
ncbi:hypothetical protein BHE74_00013179 [Ensete ventricosum]|nr:hypothetical protein BHE74_00013179 [Ensete ventricosum]